MTDLYKRSFFSRLSGREDLTSTGNEPLPWLKHSESFTDLCTRCGKCEAACETNIIIKGDGGFPRVNFDIDECTFCYRCAEACPEPLFQSREEAPWQATPQIAPSCLALENVECRSCMENCEPMAITFQLKIGRVAQPKLDVDLCTGCGACVAVCPNSSISISLNRT